MENQTMQSSVDYDIVVIGAGIQGAGVAQATAACGYRTLVIEKYPAAGLGTSSKSSKLIHGGLRYLESGQLSLVKECLDERKNLLTNAPELVKLIPFYIPVYKHSKRSAWLIWLGLFIYSLFSLKGFSRIGKQNWNTLAGLNQNDLQHVFRYYDAQTNDTQLTQAVISSAQKLGAEVLYSTDFIESTPLKNSYRVRCQTGTTTREFSCHCIINCSGPWVEQVQKKISPPIQLPMIELVAGSHIILDTPAQEGAYYLEANDGRAVFVLPWEQGKTLVGTTERIYQGNPEKLRATEEEISYLLATYNNYFSPSANRDQVIHAFAGLRVLPAASSDAFHRSRDSLIIQGKDDPRLITLIGGKLTAYRSSASAILQRVKKVLPPTSPECDTSKIRLTT